MQGKTLLDVLAIRQETAVNLIKVPHKILGEPSPPQFIARESEQSNIKTANWNTRTYPLFTPHCGKYASKPRGKSAYLTSD